MKKFFVVGNPIQHSLSPQIHNYWIKKNNINAIYEKKKLNLEELEKLVSEIKEKKIYGVNVTVPYKKDIIPYMDELSPESESTQSVNTIYLKDNKIIGHNTDIDGFELSIKKLKINLTNEKILILGAGGVVPSIIFALNKMGASEIIVSNRTKEKAEQLKLFFKKIRIVDWGELPEFHMIINATSIGLKREDEVNLDFSNIGKDKFFYDVIYNPQLTRFLKAGKDLGHKTINGKLMFIYQAHAAFKIWHNIYPEINDEVINLLDV